MKTITTGKLAKLSNVNRETIRFYERKGLIEEPERNDSGYRLYNTETVKRIKFIKNAQNMGFTLNEIEELLLLKVDNMKKCREVREYTEKKIKQVDEKIKNLQRIKNALTELADTCRLNKRTGQCPILEAFYSDEK